jgi:chromosome segregation ATPase
MFERLAEGLDSTSKLTHALLNEIRDSEADFASIKTELAMLRENVKGLSSIVREGNGAASLLTKIALIEQKLETIDKWLDNHVDVHQRSKTEISVLKKHVEELTVRLSALEKHFVEFIDKVETAEKERKEQERREQDRVSVVHEQAQALEFEHKKSDAKIKEERQKAIIKFLVALIVAGIAAGVAYVTSQ